MVWHGSKVNCGGVKGYEPIWVYICYIYIYMGEKFIVAVSRVSNLYSVLNMLHIHTLHATYLTCYIGALWDMSHMHYINYMCICNTFNMLYM